MVDPAKGNTKPCCGGELALLSLMLLILTQWKLGRTPWDHIPPGKVPRRVVNVYYLPYLVIINLEKTGSIDDGHIQ